PYPVTSHCRRHVDHIKNSQHTLNCIRYDFFPNRCTPPDMYTLSLHDALPIYCGVRMQASSALPDAAGVSAARDGRDSSAALAERDRKSTRLHSSHDQISYAVFCLKKKKQSNQTVALAALCCE